MPQTGLIHMVYFWSPTGSDDPSRDAERLAQGCRKHLPGIPGVLRFAVGVPAGTARDVVDNSYAVALLLEFADNEAQERYQEHPDHLRFVAECSPLWSRVQVYDARVLPEG